MPCRVDSSGWFSRSGSTARYCLVSLAISPAHNTSPIRLGSAIRPFITSEKVQTRLSSVVAPTRITTVNTSR